MTSAFSERVLETLETLVAPGGRARVSPFIETAQASVLFPDSAQDLTSVRNIAGVVRGNAEVVARLARVWETFSKRKEFGDPKWYREQDFLDFYLAYYFPVNVAKLQINLLQFLRREGRLPTDLRVVDVGVGTGTTIAAVADFLLAWDAAAKIHGFDAPITSFRYIGIDRSEDALKLGTQVAQALARAISANKQTDTSVGAQIVAGLERAEWVLGNPFAEEISPRFGFSNLMVLSYVLDELGSEADRLALAERSLDMPDGGILLLLEAGGKRTSTNLMRLRAQMVARNSTAFNSTGPCGSLSRGVNWVATCGQCWNARQQSLAEPQIYRAVRKQFQKSTADRRSFDEFENNLLSWSYLWMTRGTPSEPNAENAASEDASEARGVWPTSAVLHFRRRKAGTGQVPARATALANAPAVEPTNGAEGNRAPYNRALVNAAMKAGGVAGTDLTPLKRAMSAKDFESAERIAREILGNAERDDDGGPQRETAFLAERGPDLNRSAPDVLLFCWHPRGRAPTEVSLPRPVGIQVPMLVHGDEVSIAKAWYSKVGEHSLVLGIDKDTKIARAGRQPSNVQYGSPSAQVLDALAYRFFGFEALRPFQWKVIDHVLSGRSILAIAATGSGKSECFILPAMLSSGITVVVSPLVSLMTDQYEQRIRRRYGLDYLTTVFNGSIPLREREARLRRLELGYYKLAYFTPEQLERDHVLDRLRRANDNVGIDFLAMDEAHCIAQWGHDFRPAYLNLCKRLDHFGIRPVRIALTATASPYVRKDICDELNLDPRPIEQGGAVYLEASNRPELNLIVRAVESTERKADEIVRRIKTLLKGNIGNKQPGAAIVFAPVTGGNPNKIAYTRLLSQPNGGKFSAGVARFGSYLERALGTRISIYHSQFDSSERGDRLSAPIDTPALGDLSGRTRSGEQRAFIEGDTAVMVATKGFGMGIDKDNIRLVLHRSPPSNLEAYAQEAGRAGRDGELADVVLFYSPDKAVEDDGQSNKNARSDHDIQSYFLRRKYIRRIDVELVNAMLRRSRPSANGSYYLKTTDIIQFANIVNASPSAFGLSDKFEWPEFQKYRNDWEAVGIHLEILERGHWFTEVSNYVDRILQAMYRIRPEIDGVRRAFFENVDECGIRFVWPPGESPRVRGKEILESNWYFGETILAAGISSSELTELIGGQETTVPLASRLNITLREAASLLRDIKEADDKVRLVNFRSIEVPRDPMDLAGWRLQYGASHRAVPKKGGARPTIDDWFPMEAMARPRGWEVRVGGGFASTAFHTYLKEFVALHDDRKRNDESSYRRLLTDYIGVSEAGELVPRGQQRQCLRAVLLGYLGTNEVVVDGNCRSCSNCVSEERRLQEFSVDDRREVVVRMGPELVALFDDLKQRARVAAKSAQLEMLFDAVRNEEAAGRSLRGYFAGWSGKILDENPEHQTGLWLRLEGMQRGLLPFDSEQFFSHVSALIRVGVTGEEARLARLLLDSEPQLRSARKSLAPYAKALERVGRLGDASRILGEIAESDAFDSLTRIRAVGDLRRLHGIDGKLNDSEAWRRWTLIAALLEEDMDRAAQLYGDATAGYHVEEVLVLARTIELPQKRAPLWLGWASRADGRAAAVAAVFANADVIEELRAWGTRAKGIYDLIAAAAIIASAKAVVHYLSIGEGAKRPLLVAIIGLDRGLAFPERFIGSLATAVRAAFPSWDAVRVEVAQLEPACDAITATERLLPSICAGASSGAFAAEMADLLLGARHDGKSTIRVLEALAVLGDQSLEACAPTFLELANRAQEVEAEDWARVLEPSPGATRASSGLARQMLHLLAEALKPGGPSLEAHAASVEALAAQVPDCLVATLRRITEFSRRHLGGAAPWLRALASVRDREGDAAGELALWLEIAGSTPLAAHELSRALQLVAIDARLNTLADRVGAARNLAGENAVGNRLVDAISAVVKMEPLGEFTAFADAHLDDPDVWVAAWVAWLRANPAITHFQSSLRRNERWVVALRQALAPSKLLVLKYLPNDFVEASPEFRQLMFACLGASNDAISVAASLLRSGVVLTGEEEKAVKAYVAGGPGSTIGKSDVDDRWALFERYGEGAFLESNAGIEQWIAAVGSSEPKVVEARLSMLARQLVTAALDKSLVRIVAKMNLAIDNAAIDEGGKAKVRDRIPEVSLCRGCNGFGKISVPCKSCNGSGTIGSETKVRELCRQYGGDGGAGGRCPSCFGTGWGEKTVGASAKCTACAGSGSQSIPCQACEARGAIRSN